jgi:Cytochrome c oxidase assembly protein CtaG/Cox11
MENKPQMREAVTGSGKTASRRTLTRDAVVASICGFVVVLMVGASYAAVPFYDWFCRATGFNGTTQVATSAPSDAPLARKISVRFDANVGPGLPWKFEPEQNEIEVRIGEVVTVFYTVTNQAARATTADGRRLFPEDQLLLLHRTDHGSGREARNARGVLRRSGAGQGQRERRPEYDHAILYLLSRARDHAEAACGRRRRQAQGKPVTSANSA